MAALLTPGMWSAALSPVLLLLFLLVFRNWSIVRASLAGAVMALLVAVFAYKATWTGIAVETGKGVWSSVSIIAVIVPAILIYEISRESDAFSAIHTAVTRLIPDRLLQVLAVGWCFPSFLQGPSGFGVPIAVAAPLLMCIGVRPFWAVLIPLLGHAWGNTFGTLGLAWDALIQQTELTPAMAAYWKAALLASLFTGILCVAAGALICWFHNGWKGLRHGGPAVLALGLIMAGGQAALSQISPALCALIPATASLGAVFLLAKLPRYARANEQDHSAIFSPNAAPPHTTPAMTLNQALLPYYVLVGVSVLVLLTPPLTRFFGSWTMSFSFPRTETGYGFVNKAVAEYGTVAWLTHSGFFLFMASAVSGGFAMSKGLMDGPALARVLRDTAKKAVPSSLSVVFLLIMSKIMTGSGQVDVLARGTAAVTGDFYALLAPMVGALGAFMASSNMSSNILFGQFQDSMAALTHRDPTVFLAAQTGGGAIGTMFSPSKVLLGTTTAGILGSEGALLKRLIPLGCGVAVICGVVALLLA